MPGNTDSGELPTAAEITITELFNGDGTNGQLFILAYLPLEPISVQRYNSQKQRWEAVAPTNYTVSGKNIQMIPAYIFPISSFNVRIVYNPYSLVNEVALFAEAIGGGPINITISGANPSVDTLALFSPNTGKGDIKRIVIVRSAVAGTLYNANSRVVEVFDTTIGPPADNGINSLFRDVNLEPDAVGGRIVNRVFPGIPFVNTNAVDFGELLIRLSAAGGDGTSSEIYIVIIQGTEKS